MDNNTKSKYWACIIYEDSCPEDYREIITQWFLPVCISPIHDKDKYEKDIYNEDGTIKHKKGELKKPHRHVLLCFGNTTTYKTALKKAQQLGCSIVKEVSSSRGAYEYWTHKNNPEKAQYKEEDMEYFGGFSIEENIGKNTKEEHEMIQAIVDIINMKNFKEIKEIYDYCEKMGLKEYRNLIQNKTLFIKEYTKSRRFIIDETLRQS